jgi:hypothetical protein
MSSAFSINYKAQQKNRASKKIAFEDFSNIPALPCEAKGTPEFFQAKNRKSSVKNGVTTQKRNKAYEQSKPIWR